MDEGYDNAVRAAEMIISGRMNEAMNEFNRKKKDEAVNGPNRKKEDEA